MKKKAKKVRKPLKKRTIFTILSMINIMWYTVVVLIAGFLDHQIDSSLTIAWFAAWTTELALLFGIKIKDPDGEEDDGGSVETEEENSNQENSSETINVEDECFEEMELAEPTQNISMEELNLDADGFPKPQSEDFDEKFNM